MASESSDVEMGFILVPHSGLEADFVNRVWHDVVLVDSDSSSSPPLQEGCSLCHLALHRDEDDQWVLNTSHLSEWNGTVNTMACPECRRYRSDVSLLFGALKACGNEVKMRRMQIRSREFGCDLLARLSFPGTLQRLQEGVVRSSKVKRRVLSPAMQLILSLVRSDWESLENDTPRADGYDMAPEERKKQLPRLFPTSLSLEELYLRVDSCNQESTQRVPPKDNLFLTLPRELIVERIAPFLKALSLEALRCTCTYLQESLRAVVPGMRLALYDHQIRSLVWMREREMRQLLEDDCLDARTDKHRAISAGATVHLRSCDGKRDLRLDQVHGETVQWTKRMGQLSRRVARGGLLCDDPGLGKTITVLSLVLQTSGLMTSHEHIGQGVTNDDVIFAEYWEEQVVPEIRESTLLPLINSILKKNPWVSKRDANRLRLDVASGRVGSSFDELRQILRYVLDSIQCPFVSISRWL